MSRKHVSLPPMTAEEMEFGAIEYMDMCVTLQLARAEHPKQPNRALKACAKALLRRLKWPRNRLIAERLITQAFPEGALQMMLRNNEEIMGWRV